MFGEATNDDVRNHQAFDACAHPSLVGAGRIFVCASYADGRVWESPILQPAAVSMAKVRMKSDPDEQNDCLDQTPMTTKHPAVKLIGLHEINNTPRD
jgi:hypothetical protein